MGTLYLVATPIGNLEDITLRALRVLKEVSLIAAEDTRQTQKLLQHYAIPTRAISYHEHNKLARLDMILSALAEGDVALVSDAGMPGINDPGYELVQAAVQAQVPVTVVPGASAPLTALVLSTLPSDAFLYLGYLPRKSSERRARLKEVVKLPYTLIFLETPHRLLDALEDLLGVLGNRPVAVARELTKLHEEVFRGSLQDALDAFHQKEPRGEFTLVIGGCPAGAGDTNMPWSEDQVIEALQAGMQGDLSAAQLAAAVAEQSGWQRKLVYRKLQDLKSALRDLE